VELGVGQSKCMVTVSHVGYCTHAPYRGSHSREIRTGTAHGGQIGDPTFDRNTEVDEIIELPDPAAEAASPRFGGLGQLGHEGTPSRSAPDLQVAVVDQVTQTLADAHP
jgi:hypothetical protein